MEAQNKTLKRRTQNQVELNSKKDGPDVCIQETAVQGEVSVSPVSPRGKSKETVAEDSKTEDSKTEGDGSGDSSVQQSS